MAIRGISRRLKTSHLVLLIPLTIKRHCIKITMNIVRIIYTCYTLVKSCWIYKYIVPCNYNSQDQWLSEGILVLTPTILTTECLPDLGPKQMTIPFTVIWTYLYLYYAYKCILNSFNRYYSSICPRIRAACLSPNMDSLFVLQYGQPDCPPIRAACLSPNMDSLFVLQ